MIALYLQKGRLRLKDIAQPEPLKDEALVRILKAGICNTDLELMRGYMEFEGIPGHEFVGQVIEAPEKRWLSQRVVGEINISCQDCELCREGQQKHCVSRKVLGIHNKDGAFAEYLTLPLRNLHILPQTVTDTEAVFVEPLAACLDILEKINIERKDSVLILGDGKLGLLAAQVLKLQASQVTCQGKHKRKLDILKNKGIKTLLRGQDLAQKFDIVVEATGNKEGFKEALSWIKPRGKIVLKSTTCDEVRTDISMIVIEEIQIIGSRCGPFSKAIDLLERKKVDVSEMVDRDFPLEEGALAFDFAQKPETMKVLLTP